MLSLYTLIYIIFTFMIGLYYSRKVNTADGFAAADHSLPLPIATATVFATWFGSESILGIPSSFVESGFAGILSDPIGACVCLILIGLIFAKRFYNLKVLTIGDYLHKRYGKKSEIIISLAISYSYLGWIAAQFIAFGYVLNFLSGEYIPFNIAILMGAFITIVANYRGGMMSVAINDFIQTIVIIVGLIFTALVVVKSDTEFLNIWKDIIFHEKFSFQYSDHYPNAFSMITVVLAMVLGTIPQQDTFQRIIASKDAKTARNSAILGGIIYLVVTFIPIFIIVAALRSGFKVGAETEHAYQLYLIKFVMAKVPLFLQVLFFGALMAAILSTVAGTTLASAVIFSQNVYRPLHPGGNRLHAMRVGLVISVIVSVAIAILSGSSIHGLVESSGNATMAIAVTPLVAGLFWRKASAIGALASAIGGGFTWIGVSIFAYYQAMDPHIPAPLWGLMVSIVLMIKVSLLFPGKEAKWAHLEQE